MALGAGLGKASRDVIRVGSALVVLQMTAYTRCGGQAEVVVNVAVGALTRWYGMAAGKRETGCAMVEIRVEPCIHAMAGGAVGGEASGNMAGAGS